MGLFAGSRKELRKSRENGRMKYASPGTESIYRSDAAYAAYAAEKDSSALAGDFYAAGGDLRKTLNFHYGMH